MHDSNLRSLIVHLPAISLIAAGLAAVALPIESASAASYTPYRSTEEDYQACAAGLLGTGLSEEDAAVACAAALYPTDLSTCVTRIDTDTSIEAIDALSGCRQVRRPVDLATCVVDINSSASQETAALEVLDYCRRSLLPLRFSNCVVGLRTEITFSTTDAMVNCIAASSRPRDVLPNFIPTDQDLIPLEILIQNRQEESLETPPETPSEIPSETPMETTPETPMQ
ncbi:MAG: hypothetical protein HC769_05055 [Cyanobacteria bacterium CRU_2_1]|nr:hypothetical protein [Cyanobacteria bacterium RU_5_0]NJR58273.1 hypothetical protein [Cyanobacteria bacterium CRU_2_1]